MKRYSIIAVCSLILTLLVNKLPAQPGSLDPTFNPGSGASGAILCMALQTNGQIVIGGNFGTINNIPRTFARLNTDGSLDGTFDSPSGSPSSIALQADGKFLIGGSFAAWNGLPYNGVVRLRSDGSVDTTFNPIVLKLSFNMGTVKSVAGQSGGKVVIGGAFSSVNNTNRNNVAQLNSDGSLDLSFDPGTGANNTVTSVGVQSNGQVIVGGDFTAMNAVPCSHLARLNLDGSVDTNFVATMATGNTVPTLNFIMVLPGDKIMLGGGFSSVNGYSRNGIARLNADGSMDTTFNPGSGGSSSGHVYGAAVQNDGKVLVAGYFQYFNGIARNGIVRLNADGSVDGNFNPGTGVPGGYPPVYAVVSQPDGRVVIGGDFTSFNGTSVGRIARLKGDFTSTTLNLLSPQIYFGMNLSGVVSNTYRIEYTSQLNTPSLWTPLFNVMLQTNTQFIYDPTPATGTRFYRAVALP